MRFNYPGYFEPNELGGYSVWSQTFQSAIRTAMISAMR